MTKTDWHELLDTSFDDGPAPRSSVSDSVGLAQRALRRRRVGVTAVAGTSLAAAVLAVPLALGVLHDDQPSTPSDQSAANGTREQVDKAPGKATGQGVIVTDAGPMTYDAATRTIDVPPGWTVVSQIDDAAGPGSTTAEVGDGTERLFLVYLAPSDAAPDGIVHRPGAAESFDEWADSAEEMVERHTFSPPADGDRG